MSSLVGFVSHQKIDILFNVSVFMILEGLRAGEFHFGKVCLFGAGVCPRYSKPLSACISWCCLQDLFMLVTSE